MSRPIPFQQDLFCVLLLAATALLLWIPVLDEVSLNPDESQYEATASYLAATGSSPFLPGAAPGMFGLFKVATLLAGPYPIFWMRVLVLSVALATAAMLFWILRRETTPWCGLIAGLVFLHLVTPFEGFVVNREWFSTFVTMLGLTLYIAIREKERGRSWLLVVAGFLCGLALWFKLQASFITLVVPAAMLVDAVASRSTRRFLRDLPWFAAGGLGAGVAYVAPFFATDTTRRSLESALANSRTYVGANEAAVSPSMIERFLTDIPHRPVFLIAYVLAAIVAVRLTVRLIRSDRKSIGVESGPGLTLFLFYLVFSIVCVRLGGRFLAHYFQLMVPPVAALTGYAAHFFVRTVHERWRLAAAVFAVLLVAESILTVRSEALWLGKPDWPQDLWVVVFVLGVLGALAYWSQKPLLRAGVAVVSLIGLHTGAVVVQEQLALRPASMSHSPYKFAGLTEYFTREARAGDRLFVWGWAPEIYSLTGLEAASHFAFCQYVVNDLGGVSKSSLNPVWAGILIDQLDASRPRFIVDASRRSWFETDVWVYDLRNYPDFELNALLDTHYRRVGVVDDCPIWERR